MKNQRGIVWAPVLIMVGAVVVTGVVFLWWSFDRYTITDVGNVAVVNQTNSNTSVANDETKDWQTFTSPSKDYTLKIPEGYIAETCLASFIDERVRIYPGPKKSNNQCESTDNIFIDRKYGKIQDTYRTDVTDIQNKKLSSTISSAMLSGSNFKRMTWDETPADYTYSHDVIYAQNHDFAFTITNSDKAKTSQYISILSTFQFVSPDPSAEWWLGWDTKETYDVEYRNTWTVSQTTSVQYGNLTGDKTTFGPVSVESFSKSSVTDSDQALARVRNLSLSTVSGLRKENYVNQNGVQRAVKYFNVPGNVDQDVAIILTDKYIFAITRNVNGELNNADFNHVIDSFGYGTF